MILEQFNLSGKAAIVTGANTGLGKAMALGLAEAGAEVAAVYNSTPPDHSGLSQELQARHHPIQADLSDVASVDPLVDQVIDELGGFDILVNNAGIIRREDALDFSESDWDDVMNVNLKTLFFLSQAAARHFVAQGKGGKIINIASMLSYQGGIRVPSYTASKSGVLGLTRLLACEWAGKNINVNGIAPGYMSTANTKALREDPVRNQQILDRIPAGHWGEPESLQGAVVFLASEASSYLHGCTIPVDGGWLVR
ncbi:MAG: 2-dehydro-3-deoxy-D-gluconate 5-dehydrogenase KduD [Desulfovibrio sp.]|nr:MAG: 2-dehydro-3-deoxy-D-gluconate 5-dehydrogenase KduD [Desulfovibrio sp.]